MSSTIPGTGFCPELHATIILRASKKHRYLKNLPQDDSDSGSLEDRERYSHDGCESRPLLRPLSALARERATWSPARIVRVTWSALTNIGAGCEILRLLKIPAYAGLVASPPGSPLNRSSATISFVASP